MDILKDKFAAKAEALFKENKEMLKQYGEMVIDQTTIDQVFSGMRGMKSMIWETSELDANDGIRFRGYSIRELRKMLPKVPGGKEPMPEGLFWLMLVGEVPTEEEAYWVSEQWRKRADVPAHVFSMLEALPIDTHPMTQFSMAILALQTDSIFAKRY